MKKKKKRNRKLGLILILVLILACSIPVQAKPQTAAQKYAKYYSKNPVYQRGNYVIFKKQRLTIKNAHLDKKRHMVLCGTKTLQDYMFNRKHEVSFTCYPGGTAGRYLPGRGAKDQFYGYRKDQFSLDGWVKRLKTLKRKNGHRKAIRIDLYGGQYLKLSRHGKKGHYWWVLEDYFK